MVPSRVHITLNVSDLGHLAIKISNMYKESQTVTKVNLTAYNKIVTILIEA